MSDLPEMREFLSLLRLTCRYLMECGCSSNRVELLTQKLGDSWGFEVETLAIPTGVWISVRRGSLNYVELTRVRTWSVDLDRLARLNELVDQIHAHRITISDACHRLSIEAQTKPPYGVLATLLAGAGTGPILIYNYGGTMREILLALPMGVIVQILSKYLFVGGERRYISDFLSAGFAALYASACAHIYPSIDVARMIVGGLVVLVPGLVLVNAVHEVAQKNLVSGAAKLLEALVITASLACGVAFVLGVFFHFKV